MFNTTIHEHNTKVVAVTKEIEKTITPDKVTEMYDAVLEEVEKTVLRAYVIESNTLKAAVLIVEPRFDTRSKEMLLRFELNGEEYTYRGSVDSLEEQAIYNKVCDFYKNAVATALMHDTVSAMMPVKLRSSL